MKSGDISVGDLARSVTETLGGRTTCVIVGLRRTTLLSDVINCRAELPFEAVFRLLVAAATIRRLSRVGLKADGIEAWFWGSAIAGEAPVAVLRTRDIIEAADLLLDAAGRYASY